LRATYFGAKARKGLSIDMQRNILLITHSKVPNPSIILKHTWSSLGPSES
jgi:hypothetical protein